MHLARAWLGALIVNESRRIEMSRAAPTPLNIRQALSLAAQRHPDALALTGLGVQLSYAELARQVAARQAQWQAAGLAAPDRVGIAATRSADTIVAILAAIGAGLAYVPLDLAYPADRLLAMLEDAQVRAIVGEPSALASLRERVGEVPTLEHPAPRQATPHAGDGDLVYVLFTSGSTGRPKGVAMGRAPLDHLIGWHARHARLGLPARTLQFAPLSFDVHFQEIVSTLATGGTLVLTSDEDRRDPTRLRDVLASQQVTRLYLPYVALQMLAQADAEATLQATPHASALRLDDVVSAGEQLQITPDIRALFQRQVGAVLHNHYGPTESHVVTAHELSGSPADWPRIPPIGQPLPHVEVWLRPADDDAVPADAQMADAGELLLGGDSLAEGYLGRADLSAERFLGAVDGHPGRWYVTGDLVRQDADGTLTYLGRADQQLKVDGFRIEPGDIELALMAHPAIQDAVVTAPADPDGSRVLTAYLVLRAGAEAQGPGHAPNAATWRDWLHDKVPDYMVPVRFAVLARLPTTPSGKIDRRSLPAVVPATASTSGTADGSPQARIRALWLELLGLPELPDDANLFDHGARSLLVMRFIARAKEHGLKLSVADVYDRPSIAGLSALASGGTQALARAGAPRTAAAGEGIAIVGMAVRVGDAADLTRFWSNLLEDRESLRRFGPDELDPAVPAALRSQPNFVAARGVLEHADCFDAGFFGISAREATLMDPQQRLLLELCWSALEHAGIDPSRLGAEQGDRVGVYAGVSNNAYLPAMRAEHPELIAQGGEFTAMLANEKDYVATRVAHRLNLRGPAVAIHTACSTSLVAVTQAWHALAQGQCDVALAGGATVIVPQAGGYLHVEGGMESADGRCRPFDAQATGTVFGNGAGVVVLKRVSQALADGDTIYGVIRGVGLNNDGADKASFTAPSVQGQAEAIRMALNHAQVNARHIGYVEAHGTGTALGDPIEVAALTRAWSADTGETGFCTLGSVKGHVGHLVAAAGVIGLIKATLALHHERIPGTLHFQQPNPQIDFGQTPFRVHAQAQAWPRGAQPRHAAVSSFGVGGTNAHVIVEEAPAEALAHQATALRQLAGTQGTLQLLPLSAKHPQALLQRAQDLAAHIEQHPELPLAAVAATLMRGRQAMPVRAGLVARHADEAVQALRSLKAGVTARARTRVVFLFPGQGSQHPGMARGLAEALPAFREAFEACLDAAPADLAATLRHVLLEAAPDDAEASARLAQTRHAQPALFAVSYALAAWLESLGLRPEALIGHSIGEYAAACHAGVMSPAHAMRAVIARGEAMFAQAPGAMLAVRADLPTLRPLLPPEVDVAALNAPQLTVVAGPHAAIDALATALESREIGVTRLKVSHAFHSASMDGALPHVQAALSNVALQAPRLPVYSCISGAPLTAAEATDPSYWARQVRAPVAFSQAVLTEQARGDALFIEVGPGQALTALVRQHKLAAGSASSTPSATTSPIVPLLSSAQAASEPAPHALQAIGQIWAHGVELAWPVPARGPRVALPTYPFRREVHWFTRRALLPAPTATALPAAMPSPAVLTLQPLPSPSLQPPSAMNRLPRIEQEIVRILSDVAGLPPESADRDATFVDQGLDSLSLTQATLEFEKAFGIKMRFRRLLEDLDTLAKLAVFFDDQLPADRFAPEAAPVAVAGAADAGAQAAVPVAIQVLAQAPVLGAAGGSALQQLIQQQMQLMSQQLALLSGQPVAAAAPLIQQASHATAQPASAQPAIAAASTATQLAPVATPTEQPGKNALVEKPFGASARIVLTAQGEFTPAQQQWIDDFIRRYNARTGRSKSFSQQHRKVMADPRVVTGFNPMWKDLVYPIVADRSEGARIWDVDGNEYIDLLSCFGANFLGYKPAAVTQAMVEQLQAGIEVGPQHPLAAEVAQLISEFTGMERVAFCNTGSEAVMGAMRIARTVTGRKKIAIFNNSYHGIFDEVIVRGTKQLRSLSAAPGILANAVENILVLDYDSAESLEVLRQCGHELAAIMIEPIQNKYPTLQPTAFVRQLREIATQSGAALIFDEVVTGFRVAPGGAQEFYGVRADLTTYGKIIGGGLPFAAIAGNGPWLDALDGGHWQYGDDSYPEAGVTYFAGTFVRHPLALAAARATLQHLKQGGRALYESINGRTQRMVERLNAGFAARHAPVKAVHCASLWRLSWDDNTRNISLFYYLARFHGLHLYEQFGHFVTEAMSEADTQHIANTFLRVLDELMSLGLIDPRAGAPVPTGPGGGGGLPLAPPQPASHAQATRTAPLTAGQTERWLASAFDPAARRALNESFCVSLSGPVDRAALKQALADVLARHEAFRLRFDLDEPQQVLEGHVAPMPIAEIDLSGQPDADAALDAFCTQASQRDFALDRAPLAAASLLKLSDGRSVVHVVASHLVFDGWASSVFNAELAQAYRARAVGLTPDLEAAESPLAFGTTEHARFEGPEGQAALGFWQAALRNPPPPLSLGDRTPPSPRGFRADTVRGRIEGPAVQALRQQARQAGATLFQLLLTAVSIVLRQQGGQRDFVVSVPYAAQALDTHGPLMGDGVLDLPLRLSCEVGETPREVLGRVRSHLMDALEHPLMTQGTVARALGIRSSGDRPPLTSIYFNLNPKVDLGAYAQQGSGLQATMVEGRKQGLLSELFFNFYDQGEAITLDLHHSAEHFSPERAAALVQALLAQCHQLAQDLLTPVSAQPAPVPTLLSQVDARIAAWNAATAVPVEAGARLEQWISQQAQRSPQATALVAQGQSLSYAALDARANQFAQVLRQRGAAHGSLVGVCLSRGPDLVPALLGILKTGAAYVPLDPGFPKERLRYMAEDAQLRLVITEAAHADLSGLPREQQLRIDDDRAVLQAAPVSALPVDPSWPDQAPAYVIYTSGSTGKPKGVVLPQNAVCNFIAGMRQAPGLQARDGLLAVTTLSFDIAVLELFLPLVVGARVVLAQREEAMDGDVLGRVIATQQINVMQATPTTWHMLLDAGWKAPAGFKALCGGEPLPPSLAQRLLDAGIELWNMYGPTETTVWSTLSRITQAQRITVGRPIANTQVWILDEQGRPCALGQEGELCIGGEGVALGYLHRPELTAEKFVADPFRGAAGVKLYRTGDLARWAEDGQIEHLGRLDFQVKIRGYRIELGEIEARLAAQPGISRSVVMAREDQPGDVRLVGYVVPQAGAKADATALRTALRVELPDYMVPQFIVSLDSLPLLPNGKIDRKALPAPAADAQAARTQGTAPASELERAVARVMQTVLKSAELNLEDDFFSMGGHSILAAKLIALINKDIGLQITLRTLFEAPTVGKLAAALAKLKGGELPPARAPIVRRADRSRAPVTLMQQRVSFLEEIHPGRVIYHAPTGHRLRGPMNLEAFDRAFQEMVRRQDAFRTSIVRTETGWEQHIDQDKQVSLLPLEDLSHLPEDEREKTLIKRMTELVATTFQLDRAPLVSTHLFKLADDHHAMFLMPHHIIWDGWSFDVLYLELPPLYEAFLQGKPSPLPELPVTYGDFAVWHNEWLQSAEIHNQLVFWENQMRTCPPQRSPFTDRPRDLLASGNGATEFMMIPQDKAEKLRVIARQTGSTVSIVFLSMYAALMSQWIRDPAPAIGLPVRGRPAPELEGVMGFFNNMLPLRLMVKNDASCLDWIRAVKDKVTEALANQDVPFEMVAHHLKLKAGNLYQVLFNYQDVRDRNLKWGELRHERINLMQDGATEDMNLWIVEGLAGIAGGVQYDADLFLPSTARAIRDRFLALLDRLQADPEQSVDALLALAPDEQPVLTQWGTTLTSAHPPTDLFDRLQALAKAQPAQPALRLGTRVVSRAEVLERVRHFAPVVAATLNGARRTVAVASADPITHLVAALAVWHAGGDCLSLPPSLGAADLDRSDLAACVADEGSGGGDAAWPASVRRIDSLQVPGARPVGARASQLHSIGGAQRLPLSRAMASETCGRLAALAELKDGARVLAIDSDDRAWLLGQALTAWLAGGELLLGDASLVASSASLAGFLRDERIALLHLHPHDWLTLLAQRQGLSLPLQALVDVTENSAALVRALHEADCGIVTVYRPCQLGVPVAAGRITQDRDTATFGHPLVDSTLDIVDRLGRTVAAHIPGELLVRAPGQALPLQTGSLVRWRSDGVLQYLGEAERTAYLEGRRIDLGAIERSLRTHPQVAQAVVAIRGVSASDRVLTAYVQAAQSKPPVEALVRHLLSELAEDQLPASFVEIEAVPTLSNGELNIDALPLPGSQSRNQKQLDGGARPLSTSEQSLAGIWQRLLDVADVRAGDNFFDLGGNSLLAMRAVEESRALLGIQIDARRYVFETLAQLAAPATAHAAHNGAHASTHGGAGNGVSPSESSGASAHTASTTTTKEPSQKGLLGRMLGAWSGRADRSS